MPFCPHVPHPRQAQFLALDCLEALYGGAASGGKSDGLLMAALQYVERPGYAALLLRRTFADLALPGALLDRAREWLAPSAARWVEREKSWVFPTGSRVTFGYLENDGDRFRYQSSQFQFIGWDELTQFPSLPYTYLFSRLRRLSGVEIPVRMRGGTNPGGIGHEWVMARFGLGAWEEAGRPAMWETAGRYFVPALKEDNPSVDQAEYDRALGELDPVTQAQLRSGDWRARPSAGFFQRQWFDVWRKPLPEGLIWVRFWDAAAKDKERHDYWAGAKVALWNGELLIADVIRQRAEYPEARALVLQTAALDGPETVIGVEDSSNGTALAQDLRQAKEARGLTVFLVGLGGRSKVSRAGPWAARAMAGKVWLLNPGAWAGPFLSECAAFPQAGVHDDQVDAVSGGYELAQKYDAVLHTGRERAPERKPARRTLAPRSW